MPSPNVNDYRLSTLNAGSKRTLSRRKAVDWFVKGPIPGPWLSMAAKMTGKTLHVALALWYMAGLTKRSKVKLTRKTLDKFGVGRDATRHGLTNLESGGLVTVARRTGRAPEVTLLTDVASENTLAV